jgi:hypothetical protein
MEELENKNIILKLENDELKKKYLMKEDEYNILKNSYSELFKHNYVLFQENKKLKEGKNIDNINEISKEIINNI